MRTVQPKIIYSIVYDCNWYDYCYTIAIVGLWLFAYFGALEILLLTYLLTMKTIMLGNSWHMWRWYYYYKMAQKVMHDATLIAHIFKSPDLFFKQVRQQDAYPTSAGCS